MRISYESLIWSEEQLLKFYNTFFSESSSFHTDFFCLAARKKYMTEEERKRINLGDTCMMFKTILKEYDEKKFLSKIYQADASASFFTDRDGNYIPRSCIAYYMNLNKTNVLKATRDFKDQMNLWDYDLATSVLFNNTQKKDNLGRQIKTVQNNLLKSFQDPKNTEGKWLDIDCDVKGVYDSLLKEYKERLIEFFGATDVHIIHSHGGAHIIFDKNIISAYNRSVAALFDKKEIRNHILTPDRILSFVREMVLKDFSESDVKEIEFNQNLAVQIPGTVVGTEQITMI